MTVTLTPDLERFVERAVHEGRYTTADLAIQEAVRLLRMREEQLERLNRELQIADDQGKRGAVHVYENGRQVAEDIKRAGRELLRQHRPVARP